MTDSAGLDDRGTEWTGSPGEAGSTASASAPSDPLDLERLARDWITLWQSELSALAADQEVQETWQGMLALWAGVASAAVSAMVQPRRPAAPSGHDHGGQSARPEPSPRPAPAAAASDARDAEIERLTRHIERLEARLEELERRRHPRRTAKRKR